MLQNQNQIKMKTMKNLIKPFWIAVLGFSSMPLQFWIPSVYGLSKSLKTKQVQKPKKDKLPGRLGLGFGPFYTNYVLEKGLKK